MDHLVHLSFQHVQPITADFLLLQFPMATAARICALIATWFSDRKIEPVAPATYLSPMIPSKSLESVRRAARMYATNKEAAAALGIGSGTFAKICRENGIETPHNRKLRKEREGFVN